MTLFRGFIAIDISSTSQILAFENEIKKTGADVKLVEPENIHITLKFLGDTEEKFIDAIEQSMKESVKTIKSFPVTLRGTGVFPNKNYMKVIWIGILDNGQIGPIAHTLDSSLASLGFKKETRGFSAHLTIGRVRTARNKEKLLTTLEHHQDAEFTTQEVHAIALKKSELTPNGPIYTTLREIHI
ncbi:MAG TPA: RNA 2',3'-cyclic phosphodiesterase [Thermoplasmata archaeon]|jgi:RNA 2',3'-cyclic 3'-phosphodiesterase|nr:RNA 2',3'-cyclic phosphodiesterase [Thermoplasmata archaeon]